MKFPSRREVIKGVVSGMTSQGIRTIIDGVVDKNVEREEFFLDRACLWMAKAAMGITISATCKVQTDLMIDSVLDYRTNRFDKKLRGE